MYCVAACAKATASFQLWFDLSLLQHAGGIICWGDGANGKLLAPNIPKGSGGAGPAALTILEDGQVC